MARFLLGLKPSQFERYKENDLHIIPRGSWNRLTEEEKAKARKIGIEARADDYQTHNGKPVDELPIAAQNDGPDAVEEVEDSKGKAAPIAEIAADERTWFVVRQILDIIIAAPNARLEAECFRISSGLGMLDSITEASVARKHGLTRAAISKRCVRQTKLIGIRPSQYMRSIPLRETYRKARIRSLEKQGKRGGSQG